jgi:glycosyltransferase involved in cell wall biosynthesis
MTVLIATHNGADTLDRTLRRLTEIEAPPGGWKLVIVNNASTDETRDIIHRYATELPLEYLEENRVGKNFAMNTGLGRLEGDLLVCSDDDVIPDSDWLVELRAGVDRHKQASLFGGTIDPLYEVQPPAWLTRTVWTTLLFAETDHSLPEGEITEAAIFGPNMAVRSEVIRNGARFAERFGPVGRSGMMGSETEFIARMARQGHKMCFLPRARVRHIVQKSQLKWRWMLKRCYRHGRTMFAFEKMESGREFPQLLGVPRYLVRRVGERVLTLPFVALRLSPFVLFAHLRGVAYDLGAIREARGEKR